jgi:O-antigen ligase
VRRRLSHLHCNPIHIAAERGLPALAAWAVAIGVFVWRAAGALREPDNASTAAVSSALLAIVGLTTAGLFEYNWGDSEIWILTLFLLSVPPALAAEDG